MLCYAMIYVVHAVQLINDLMVVHDGDSLIGSGRDNLSVQWIVNDSDNIMLMNL